MKRPTICVVIALLLFSTLTIHALSPVLDTSDISLLKRDFSETVEWNYLGETRILTKEETRSNLAALLAQLDPTKILEQHQGDTKDNRCNYGVIRVFSHVGDYRIFYYCEKSNGGTVIKKIRINRL